MFDIGGFLGDLIFEGCEGLILGAGGGYIHTTVFPSYSCYSVRTYNPLFIVTGS